MTNTMTPNVALSNVSDETKIRHKNGIKNGLLSLPLNTRRILYLCIAQIDSKKLFDFGAKFKITTNEYSKLCGIERNASYKDLYFAGREMQGTTIEVERGKLLPPFIRPGEGHSLGEAIESPSPSSNKERHINVTRHVDYYSDEAYVEVVFSVDFEPYIALLQNDYTTLVLKSALNFKEQRVIRIYQLIREAMSTKGKDRYLDITVDDLRDAVGLYETKGSQRIHKYSLFKEFNRSVIQYAVKRINNDAVEFCPEDSKETNRTLSAEVIERRCRKAYKIRFHYAIKDTQQELPIN